MSTNSAVIAWPIQSYFCHLTYACLTKLTRSEKSRQIIRKADITSGVRGIALPEAVPIYRSLSNSVVDPVHIELDPGPDIR